MLTGSTTSKKILLGLDLDYSHFNSSITHTAAWFSSESFWIDLYKSIVTSATELGVEIIFAVITKKPKFDDICEEAALKFRQFLETSSVPMYIDRAGYSYCLADVNGTLRYEGVGISGIINVGKDITFSNFMIIELGQKSTALLKLSKVHGIPEKQCIMVDDTPDVLADVKAAGFHPISLHCFHDQHATTEQLNNADYVKGHLEKFSKELKQKVADIIAEIKLREKHEVAAPAAPKAQVTAPGVRRRARASAIISYPDVHISAPVQSINSDPEVSEEADLTSLCDKLRALSVDFCDSVTSTLLDYAEMVQFNSAIGLRFTFMHEDNLLIGDGLTVAQGYSGKKRKFD